MSRNHNAIPLWQALVLACGTQLVAAQGLTGIHTTIRRLHNPPYHVLNIALSSDGKVLAGTTKKLRRGPSVYSITLWDLDTGETIRRLRDGSGSERADALDFSRDRSRLAAGNDYGSVTVWNLATGTIQRRLKVSKIRPVQHVAFSPSGDLLATGTNSGEIDLWDLSSGKLKHRLTGLSTVNALAFSPHGDRIAGGCGVRFGGVSRQELQGMSVGELRTDAAGILSREVGQLRVWDVASGQSVWTRDGGRELFIASIAFSPRGDALATGGEEVRLWDAGTGVVKHTLRSLENRRGDIVTRPVAFSPDGQVLAIGGWTLTDGKVRGELQTWNAATGQFLHTLAHLRTRPTVKLVRFSSQDRLIAAMADGRDAIVEDWHLP